MVVTMKNAISWDVTLCDSCKNQRFAGTHCGTFEEGNNRIQDTAGNNCKLVYNCIRDTVVPFLVTVTIGL
jgi:hypothetical protein